MNCRDIEPLLLAERDGVLTTEQHASLDQHVASCPACHQLRAGINQAMISFRTDATSVVVPDAGDEWLKLRARMHDPSAKPAKKRPLAPVIWLGAPLAAAAAIAFAYFNPQTPLIPSSTETNAPVVETAQAEYVEAGDAQASTMVYVDKESGWLVVWATDNDTVTSS